MSDAHLVLRGVHRHFGEGETLVRVLEAAELTVNGGELVALVAPSGAGKSTLLQLCGLLERPQSGDIEITGLNTATLSDRARTLLRRHTVGYVYQFHHLLPEFSALENVMMPQMIAGTPSGIAEERSLTLLDALGVRPRAKHRPAEMSGGEQQRIAIARAAANNPRIILADEPTGNLDPATSDIVFDALKRLIKEQNVAALIATHNYDLARKADRVVTLRNGLVVPHKL
ncbi:MAG: transporter [Devosia sp.]|nr:transporter [Devosia sp.]